MPCSANCASGGARFHRCAWSMAQQLGHLHRRLGAFPAFLPHARFGLRLRFGGQDAVGDRHPRVERNRNRCRRRIRWRQFRNDRSPRGSRAQRDEGVVVAGGGELLQCQRNLQRPGTLSASTWSGATPSSASRARQASSMAAPMPSLNRPRTMPMRRPLPSRLAAMSLISLRCVRVPRTGAPRRPRPPAPSPPCWASCAGAQAGAFFRHSG